MTGSGGEERRLSARVRGAWRMILANYLFRAVASIVGAAAAADVLASAVAGRPDGDRDLFANGAALFIETGLHAMPKLGRLAVTEVTVVVGVALLGVFPFAALLHALVEPAASIARRAKESLRLGLRLGLVFGLASLAEALLVAVALFAATRVAQPRSTPDKMLAASGLAMTGLVPLVLALLVHDLARVAVVARGATVLGALRRALFVLRRRPLSVIGSALLAAATSLVLIALGFGAAWIGLRTSAQIIAVLALQQLAILAAVAVRAAYFARLIAIDRQT